MEKTLKLSRSAEISTRVHLCADRAIEIGATAFPTPGQRFVPDKSTAYVEFFLSHAFPVVTTDKTAIHPQVVANSYSTMFGKVFNFAHLMRQYNPRENPRDRILGTIMSVEFPAQPAGGWKVQKSRAAAPGIRAVACMHRAAEGVDDILSSWFNGGRNAWSDTWTVSMEQDYFLETSGFLVRGDAGRLSADWKKTTPEDLLEMDLIYVPAVDAPVDLLACFNAEESRVVRDFLGFETLMLFGGLNNSIHYKGTGLTPLGKEAEAMVAQMLASGISFTDLAGGMEKLLQPSDYRDAGRSVLLPLRRTLEMNVVH